MKQSSIIEVWKDELVAEFDRIRAIPPQYNHISMDTEFPGIVAKPVGNFNSQSLYTYQQLRCNADLLKIIQLGLTFSDHEGNMPTPSTWQFNFAFNLDQDMYAEESLSLLIDSELDFKKHKEMGIDISDFGELLMTSGLVLSDKIWISFHSSYDFGYLLRILQGTFLPEDPNDFLMLLEIYFNKFYDLKHLLSGGQFLKRGLQEIADSLEVARIGIAHQAGSDSLLTSMTFFKLKSLNLVELGPTSSNKLFGIGKRNRQNDTCVES